MDIARPDLARNKKRKTIILISIGIVALLAVTAFAFRSGEYVPVVKREDIWTGVVRSGEMVRQVRGTGRLVPENTRWITARTEGRVEERRVQSGAEVQPDTVILVMSNPSLDQQLMSAKLEWEAAEADLVSKRVSLQSNLLATRGALEELKEQAEMADLEAEINRELFQRKLISELNRKRSDLRAYHLAKRVQTVSERASFLEAAIEPQLATQQTQVARAKARYDLLLEQSEALVVRAGSAGILQRLEVEPGMRVEEGAMLAQVADLSKLKAIVDAPESQAREIRPGQPVIVDTRTSGEVSGIVSRIDPDVQNGYVKVDVSFPDGLPTGCRTEQSIEGSIELERLSNALYMDRPAQVVEYATAKLFRINPTDGVADRVGVEFGRSSASTIEVVKGLKAGDEIVLSDMTRWADSAQIRVR